MVQAQNLITNGGFETFIGCPGNALGSNIDLATPWQSANINASTAAIFNSCATSPTVSVPINGSQLDGYQYPLSGNGYAGFGAFSSIYPDRRKYIRYPLDEPLNFGITYCLNFYVNLYNTSSNAVDAIGAYFSDSALACSGFICVLNYSPQVSNPAGNILSDTLNWMQISGCFVAQGTERFMHIGNFKTDSATQYITIPNTLGGAYYYIDDVSLYADTSLSIKETVKENSFTVFPNPASTTFSIKAKKNVLEVVVSDVSGKVILQQPFSQSIDVSNLANGCYFLRCKFEDGESAFVKISVQH
jgi:Secretion system C-terminal sorting domain